MLSVESSLVCLVKAFRRNSAGQPRLPMLFSCHRAAYGIQQHNSTEQGDGQIDAVPST
jgi:hypothetical protein